MKKISSYLAFISCAAVLLIYSCSKNDNIPPSGNQLKTGTVSGTVTSANGTKAINHAFVYIDVSGTIYSTYSVPNGSFTLTAPEGNQTLCIQTGDGKLFHTCVSVTIIEGQNTDVPESETRLLLTGELAYIAGIYDKIEALVDDTLGYPITEITDNELLDTTLLFNFDAVFMNCNDIPSQPQAAYDNLKTYVEHGGNIYVSDFASAYLLGDYLYYGACDRPGGFIDDSLLCTQKTGPMMTIPSVSIVDTSFQNYMGTTTMDVDFDLDGWEVVQYYNSSFWDVIVSDATYGPLCFATRALVRLTTEKFISLRFIMSQTMCSATICAT